MGNGHPQKFIESDKSKISEASAQAEVITLKKYNKLGVIGRGGFGKVTLMKNLGMENLKQER